MTSNNETQPRPPTPPRASAPACLNKSSRDAAHASKRASLHDSVSLPETQFGALILGDGGWAKFRALPSVAIPKPCRERFSRSG